MSWREQLIPASLSGIAFGVKGHQLGGGRRAAVFEYPNADLADAEDLGRRARVYRIDAFVLGADYLTRRNQLIEVLETAGIARLAHPWLGVLWVQPQDYQLTESTEHGGMAVFSLTFAEADPLAGEQVTGGALAVSTDTVIAVKLAVANGNALVWQDLARVPRVPLRQISPALLDQLKTVQNRLLDAAAAARRLVRGATQAINDYTQAIAGIALALEQLAAMPERLAGEVQTAIDRLLDALLTVDPASAVSVALGLAQPVTASEPLPRALQAAVAVAAIGGAAQGISMADYPDRSAIDTAHAQWLARLDGVGASLPDSAWSTLQEVLVALGAHVAVQAPRQQRRSLTPAATLPALVLAYQLYADCQREAEIVAANPALRHPGFVPGGQSLEVPVDA